MSDSLKVLASTIVYASTHNDGQASTADRSQIHVGLVSGTAVRFSAETAHLLRSRLRAASLLLAVTLAIAFGVALLLSERHFILVRTAVLLAMVVAYLVLRSKLSLTLQRLRFVELLVFGGLVTQISAMMWLALKRFAEANDFATVIGAENVYLADFSVLILVYGMLMPNSWKRAAAILVPMACVPYSIIFISQWRNEQVANALEADHFGMALPLPFIAALAAVYGTHVINSVRREAFNAKRFGQYRLKEKIGTGGMGEVYRAEHVLLKRPCAIKLINKGDDTNAAALARFEREVQSTARLTHWNSVEVFDYGHTEDGVFYYVMEYLTGKSLDDLIREHGAMPAERAVHLMRQVCRALEEAHHLGLVHRDLKPANIFAAKLGGIHDVAKLLDFGLVRQADADWRAHSKVVQEGSFGGSPLYMPPEQITDFNHVDGRSDIYSLGAVAYFLLTARPPFLGDNPIKVLLAHANEQVVPPTKIESTIPRDLEQIVLRCLEKRPQDRFQNVESLGEALAKCECADSWTEQKATVWWREIGMTTT